MQSRQQHNRLKQRSTSSLYELAVSSLLLKNSNSNNKKGKDFGLVRVIYPFSFVSQKSKAE